MNIIKSISHRINLIKRIPLNRKKKKLLTNSNFTVISSNCIGCCMLHDLGQPFNSPFVNLFLNGSDFIKYLKNMEYYNSQELCEGEHSEKYPIGYLKDIKIYFAHYKNFEEAKNCWYRRLKRINYSNMYIIHTDRNSSNQEQELKEFDALPYKHKVVFTHLQMPDIKSSYYIKGFENDAQIGQLTSWCGGGKNIMINLIMFLFSMRRILKIDYK